jgi:DNA-binding beta-propeller fold protein YncE
MHFVSERRDHRLVAVASALIALAFVAVFAFAARAQAAETLYWNNYSGDPDTIGFSSPDGSGGGALDLTGVELDGPEGMAVDPVTGRLYIAAISNGPENKGEIVYANLSGGGGGVFTAPGAPVSSPEGVAIDPATRMIFWINTGENDSIAWAKLDGSAGGTLNLTGANFKEPYRLALDPVAGRVYWGSENPDTNELVISYANVNNTGGGNLNTSGSAPVTSINGIAVDPTGGRVYWLNESSETLSYTKTDNTGGGEVDTTGAAFNGPYGLALDPGTGKAYWANYGGGETRTGAFGTANYLTGGSGGSINIATAPVDGPQDPMLLKSPTATGAPVIGRDAANPALLACPSGSWAPDYPGSFVYQAPQSYGYQWALNGAAIAGATSSTLTATAPGAYTCTVTGTNVTGFASQTSGTAATVNAAKVKLTVKPRKAKAKPGKFAKFRIQALNQGDLQTGNAKVCVKVPKKAKKALKTPKCKKLGVVGALTKKTAKLKLKVKPTAAKGSYKVKLQVKGSPGKAVKATVKVLG